MVLFSVTAIGAAAGIAWQFSGAAPNIGTGGRRSPDWPGRPPTAAASLLLRMSRWGAGIGRVLAPMGRMALANYLTAPLIAAAVGPLIGLPGSAHYGRMALLAAVILLVQ